MTAALQDFETYLIHEKRASKNTYLSYIRDLAQFEQYILGQGVTELADVSMDQVDAYLQKLRDEGKANATIIRTAAALKCFYNRLVLQGVIEESPVRHEKQKRQPAKIPEVLTPAEVTLPVNPITASPGQVSG